MLSTAASLPSHARVASPKQAGACPVTLVSKAKIGMADRVLVMGRNVIEQVIALAQADCGSVMSLSAASPYPRDEPADVLWFVEVEDIQNRLETALHGGSIPRVIIIEFCGAAGHSRHKTISRQLHAKGYVRVTAHRTDHGSALMATRPAWLEQVI